MSELSKKAQAVVCAGLMAMSMLAPVAAFADAPQPSAGAQTGAGTTDVTVQLNLDPNIEDYGGPAVDPENNPDNNHDTYGDNVAFTVPSAINFIADAQGNLTGPSADATYIENKSTFGIHVSSFDVDPEGDWTIIRDDVSATADNSADFQFGVYDANNADKTDMLDAGEYLTKKNVNKPALWNMTYEGGTDNKVELTTKGNIFKVNKDISSQTKIATIKTYVSPKLA